MDRVETPTAELLGKALCSVEGCDRGSYARGWCEKHYWRWWKHGDVDRSRLDLSVEQAFWQRVDFHGPMRSPYLGPCWLWTGWQTRGYGIFYERGTQREVVATRWCYERFVGPISDGLHLDHLCRVPVCVNFAHLEPVTCWENVHRGNQPAMMAAMRRNRTHCRHGHELTDENVRVDKGYRRCRTCQREQERALRRQRRGY